MKQPSEKSTFGNTEVISSFCSTYQAGSLQNSDWKITGQIYMYKTFLQQIIVKTKIDGGETSKKAFKTLSNQFLCEDLIWTLIQTNGKKIYFITMRLLEIQTISSIFNDIKELLSI